MSDTGHFQSASAARCQCPLMFRLLAREVPTGPWAPCTHRSAPKSWCSPCSAGATISHPTYELVQRVFAELAGHRSGCSCWRCQAAAKVDPDRVWKCLQAWRRTYEQ